MTASGRFLPGEGRLALLAVSASPASLAETAVRAAWLPRPSVRQGAETTLVYFLRRRQTPSPRQRAGRICTFRWRVVKWYHKGLWNLCSRFESWPASRFPGGFALADALGIQTSIVGNSPQRDEQVGLVVLAAGAGTRMRSTVPNRAYRRRAFMAVVRGRRGRASDAIVLVVAPETVDLARGSNHPDYRHRGPGSAARHRRCGEMRSHRAAEVDRLVVLYSDHPLPGTLDGRQALLAGLRASGAKVAILTATSRIPRLRPHRARRIGDRLGSPSGATMTPRCASVRPRSMPG